MDNKKEKLKIVIMITFGAILGITLSLLNITINDKMYWIISIPLMLLVSIFAEKIVEIILNIFRR